MSRSAQGGRRDLALLRKLKEQARDPNFSPSQALSNGAGLLEKASKIKGFLKQQKTRSDTATAKTEWLLTAQQLQEEREGAEKELTSCLESLQTSLGDTELSRELLDALAQWQATSEECSTLRQELREQVSGVARVHASLKSYGVEEFQAEAGALMREVETIKGDIRAQLDVLATELGRATEQVRAVWPSALGPPAADGAVAGALASGLGTPARTPSFQRSASSLSNRVSASAPNQQQPHQQAQSGGEELSSSNKPSQSGEGQATGVASLQNRGSLGTGISTGLQPDPGGLSAPIQQPPDGDHSNGNYSQRTSFTGARFGDATDAQSDVLLQGSVVEGGDLEEVEGLGAGAAAAWAAEAHELEVMMAKYPLADALSKARVREVFSALRERFQDQLRGWSREARSSGLVLGSATGGWPSDQHSMFLSLRERYWKEMGPKGASREALMRKLAVLMPQYTLPQLMAHDDWLTSYRLLQRKRKDLLSGWARERSQFIEDSSALLEESEQVAIGRAAIAAERLAHELARERVHEDLEHLRAAAAEQAAREAAERAAAEAAEAPLRAAAEAAARAEAQHKRELVAAYRSEVEAREQERAEAAAAAAREAEEERARWSDYNKERVEWRHAEYAWKQDKVKEAKAAKEAEAAAREERLARLRALVAPEVEADPMRLLLPTDASSAVDDKAPGVFKPVNGYTTDQVYKDARFKIMDALQRAGLHQTSYGRQVVAAAPAATATRVDNLTSNQRLGR